MGSMTALGITNPTLLDVARKTDPDGKIATDVAEVIAQTNDFIPYLSWKEGNMATGHKSTIRSGYPAGTWRKFYGVVSEDKTETQQVTDTCGMLQNLSDVDEDLADLSGEGALRSDEDIAAVQGMTETFASTFFYGNTDTDPEKFHGLSARFDTPSTDSSKIGFNMIDGGAVDGQTDCTSVWLLGMGPMSLFNIFPKGSAAGLKMENCGLQWKYNSAQTGNLRVYRTYFKWHCGLVVKDWRYVVRICNIDTSSFKSDPTGATYNLVRLMIQAEEKLPTLGVTRNVWCANRTIRYLLRTQSLEQGKYGLTPETVAGKRVETFNGTPFVRVDAITNAETAILDAAGTFSGP